MRFFQSLDMFKKKKNSMEDTVDIRDILEAGGHGLVMTQRFPTGKGEKLNRLTIFVGDHEAF